jgi:transcriptional regulator with XRE-family HTH domain
MVGGVRRLRLKAGLTQQKLANLADLSISAVVQAERGLRGDPRLSTLRALAGVLGVTLDELAGGPAKSSPEKPRRPSGTRRRGRK